MRTISQEEYKKLYGADSLAAFNQPAQSTDKAPASKYDIPSGNYAKSVGDSFKGGIDRIGQGINEANPTGKGGLAGLATGALKIAGGAAQSLFSPIAPAAGAVIDKPTQAAGNALSNTKPLQEWGRGVVEQGVPADQETGPERFVGAVGDAAMAGGAIAGGAGTPKPTLKGLKNTFTRTSKPASEVPPVGPSALEGFGKYAKDTVTDIVPGLQRTINHQVARALDLTPTDLNNIFRSTGNDVGRFLSDNNLIGSNKETTQANVQSFFKENYDSVRSEIGKVDKTYKQYQVPRYVDALKQLKASTEGVPGLEKAGVEVENLLKIKKDLTLPDVQRVKELFDDYFSLYKDTGDVKQGVAKEGLANMRKSLKEFIEKEVKENTGADIRDMNKNVSTAKSIDDAITTRSQRGLTRANITTRDIATGWAASMFGGPLVGIAAVIIKKLATSPTVRLRFARALDKISDARKAQIKADLEAGEIPPELQEAVIPTQGSSEATETMPPL